MTITHDELRSIMDAIWQSLLGSGLTAAEGASVEPRPRVVGRVEITGRWEGVVTIDCDADLAADVAAAMFGLEDGGAAPDEIRDALGELANMAGGNIKSLLPAPSQLGLPTVSEDALAASVPDDTEPLHSVAFDVEGKHIRLNVFEVSSA
ncbi:MAG: chemotaxis protein CheX [Actinomycetota bacterium]|nr:chemotaxis protein CheX [Actinomycetota bacterium]